MMYKSISLDVEDNIPQKGSEKEIQKRVDKFLQEQVREMIAKAQQKLTGHPLQPTLPLIRLRVEYSNEMHVLAAGRFGNYFHDQVANPSEILLFRKRSRDKKPKGDNEIDPEEFEDALPRHMIATKMEDYISKYFEQQEAADEKSQLKVLDVKGIAEAVKIFIEKDQRDAIRTAVEGQVKKAVEEAATRNDAFDGTL
jgi:double-strand break repair protein MRE11